jgi:hypothetical protein
MATILKYHQGNLIPVNSANETFMASGDQKFSDKFGESVYYQAKKMTMKKRFYGNLMIVLLTANVTLVLMVVSLQ